MKIDNPNHYRHYRYQNIVNRVFLMSLFILYMIAAPTLDPLGFSIGFVKLVCIYCVVFPITLIVAAPITYLVIDFVIGLINDFSCWFHNWIRGY